MRVAMVACMEPMANRPSGIATYVDNVIIRLQERGIEVTLIGCGDANGLDLPYPFVSLSKDSGISSAGFLARLVSQVTSLDIPRDVIVHTHRPDEAIPFLIFHRANPKVVTLHGSHARNVLQEKGQLVGSAYCLAERYSLRRNDRVMSVSKANEEFYTRRYPWLGKKLVHVPQGVDADVFKPLDKGQARDRFGLADEDIIVLFAGRSEREKRIDLLIESFERLQRLEPKAKLLIVGDGREKIHLKSLVTRKGLERVSFRDSVPRSEMPWLLNCADVFALLSSHEGLPLAVLEALSCGIPVVATGVGDIPRFVRDGKTGRIVRDAEPSSIADALFEVITQGAKLSQACRDVALGCSWDSVADILIDLYEEVRNERKHRSQSKKT